jgi:uracil-DNA glycosylase family 4
MSNSLDSKHGGSGDPLQLPVDTGCRQCPLGQLAAARNWPVCQPTIWDSLSRRPAPDIPIIVFIGDAPMFDERTGRPFSGVAGSLLRGRDEHSLFSRFRLRELACVWLCNAVRCPSSASTIPTSAFNACTQRYLESHLESLGSLPCSDRILMMMGAPAISATMKLAGFTGISSVKARQMQGTTLPIRGIPWVGVSTHHPQHIMVQPERFPEMLDHFHILRRYISNKQLSTKPTIISPVPPQSLRKD